MFLVKAQPLFRRHCLFSRQRVVERARRQQDLAVSAAAHVLDDGVAVHWSVGEREQDLEYLRGQRGVGKWGARHVGRYTVRRTIGQIGLASVNRALSLQP